MKHVKKYLGKSTMYSSKNSVLNEIFSKLYGKVGSRWHILVIFPSHLKKLHSLLRFWLKKFNCGFFHTDHSWKKTTKQLFLTKMKKITIFNAINVLWSQFLSALYQSLSALLPLKLKVLNCRQIIKSFTHFSSKPLQTHLDWNPLNF